MNRGKPELQSRVKDVIGDVRVCFPWDSLRPLDLRYFPEEPIQAMIAGGLGIRDNRRSSYERFHDGINADEGRLPALLSSINRPAKLVLLGESTVYKDWWGVPTDVTDEHNVLALYEPDISDSHLLLSAVPGSIDARSNPIREIYNNSQVGRGRWTVALTDSEHILIGNPPSQYENRFQGYIVADQWLIISGISEVDARFKIEGVIADFLLRQHMALNQA